MAKLTTRSALTTLTNNDLFHTVDVSDTTDDPEGSSKKITSQNIKTYMLNNVDISTFNNDVGFTTNTGTVTSVGFTANNYGQISGSPLTSAGTINLSVGTNSPTKNHTLLWNGSNAVWAAQGTSFTFSVASFVDNQASPQLLGTGTWKNVGTITFTATYTNGPATSGSVQITGGVAAWGSALNMGAPNYTGPTTNAATVPYPASPNTTVTFTLTASDGTDSPTSAVTVTFNNNVFFGVSSTASGYTEANVEGLANTVLLTSNTRARTFSVTAGSGEYIIYAYPTRLGTATFTVGGFEGGFQSPETVSITNSAGYTENYYVYRSTNPSLGATTVVVS
jgi:hypothetical protein